MEDNKIPNLVNNQNLKIIDADTVVYFQWILNPTSLFNLATQNCEINVNNIEIVFITPAPAGIYTKQITNKGTLLVGNHDLSLIHAVFNHMALSSSNFEKNNLIEFYPNPYKEYINSSFPLDFKLTQITIYDSLGKIIKQFDIKKSNRLNISELE